jgi:putative colanic acid biosynthesis acetyltransferase WcaF
VRGFLKMDRSLADFRGSSGVRKSRFYLWWGFQNSLFANFATPNQFRVFLLRLFGASIGSRVIIRRGVRVHFPWNLTVGDDTWIGEQAWFINHVPITIGSNVCISQGTILTSGSHDMYSASLDYKHAPIEVRDGAWICLRATVLAGVSVGTNSVVSAGEVLRESLPDNSLYIENSVRPIEYERK